MSELSKKLLSRNTAKSLTVDFTCADNKRRGGGHVNIHRCSHGSVVQELVLSAKDMQPSSNSAMHNEHRLHMKPPQPPSSSEYLCGKSFLVCKTRSFCDSPKKTRS